MLYNNINLSVAKCASKHDTRLELASVFFTDKKTVATDSFKLIEITTPTGSPDIEGTMQGCAPFLVNAHLVSKIKLEKGASAGVLHLDGKQVTITTGTADMKLNREDAKFPDYERVFPTGKPIAEVVVNAGYLVEVLEILGKLDATEAVTIKVYGANEPLVIEAKNNQQHGRSMVMPMRS